MKAGQPLYQLDPAPFQAAYASAQANVRKAESTLATARTVASVTTAPTGFEGEGFPVHRAVAGVPMVVGMMDYQSKSGGLGPEIWPTGDYKADMKKVAEIYSTVVPKYPAKGMTGIFAKDET